MNDKLSIKIKELRKSIDMTQQQLADSIGVSKSYINKIEHSQTKKPSLQVLSKIADMFKIDFVELIEIAGYDIEDLIINDSIYSNFLYSYSNNHLNDDLEVKYSKNNKIDIYKVIEDYKNDKINNLDAIYLFVTWTKEEKEDEYL